jgi:hypothetical protein
VIERGYEAYVAKDEASAYEGGPMRRWLIGEAEGLDGRGGRLAIRISEAPPTADCLGRPQRLLPLRRQGPFTSE